MQRYRLLIVALVAVAVTACSGQSANSTATASAAPARSAPASTVAPADATTGPVAESSLPVYPGATKAPMQSLSQVNMCGHKMTMTMYKVADPVDTVAAWYADKMPDSKQIKVDHMRGGVGMHDISVISSDGATAAVVLRMIMPPALSRMAAKMNTGTTLGLVTYDPPFTQDELSLYMRASNGDEAAKKEAKIAFKEKCGANFKIGNS